MFFLSIRDVKARRILHLLVTAAALTSTAALVCGVVGSRSTADEKPAASESDARKIEREENRKGMELRARATRVRVSAKTDDAAAQLVAKPLSQYTDQPRRIVDATLWGWLADGRLVAVCKFEKYDFPQPERQWLYCFGSLAPALIDAEWKDLNRNWSASKPGIELQSFSDGPPAAEAPAARLRQIKDIASRFQAIITTDPANDTRQEMRLLPHPLYRYEKPAGDVLDGAAFGLTTNGTNPDAILIVELHRSDGGPPTWKFAVAGMTSGGLSVKLGDREVWSRPSVPDTGSYDTWLWFFGK